MPSGRLPASIRRLYFVVTVEMMTMMTTTKLRSPQEILQRYLSRRATDPLGFEVGEYLPYMSFRDAQSAEIFSPEMPEETFNSARAEYSHEKLLEEMQRYMPFAWEKANGCRGISANRSVDHYIAWIWLMGDDAFLTELEAIPYQHYGKEILVAICQHYGWDSAQWDDGIRTNF
jgi:hypothetical protein